MRVLADLIEANEAMTLAYEDRTNTLAAFRKQNDAAERVNKLTDSAEEEFATQNGWRIAKTPFNPDLIGKKRIAGNRYLSIQSWVDHPTYYRTKAGIAAAIIGQPYGSLDQFRDELDTIAQRCGLKWSVPTNERASFWCPNQTLFIVLTKPEHSINWSTEQPENPPSMSEREHREEGKNGASMPHDLNQKAIAEHLTACGCPRDVVLRHIAAMKAIAKHRSKQELKQRKTYRVLGRRRTPKHLSI